MRVQVSDQPRLVEVISRDKICPRCNLFCLELVPRFPRAGASKFFARFGRLPKVKVFCRNRCHESPAWGWRMFDPAKFRGVEFPRR